MIVGMHTKVGSQVDDELGDGFMHAWRFLCLGEERGLKHPVLYFLFTIYLASNPIPFVSARVLPTTQTTP